MFIFFVCVRTFKFYSLSKFQLYYIELSTIVIILIQYSDLIHLVPKSFYLFTNLSLFPPPPAPGNHFSAVSISFTFFFIFHGELIPCSICLLCLPYFLAYCPQDPSTCGMRRISFFLMVEEYSIAYIYITSYLFIC